MGLYDTIRFHGDEAPRCAAGHPLSDLQTKDLDCVMNEYSVFAGRLYRPATERAQSAVVDDQGRLILTQTRTAAPASITIDAAAYGYCTECLPVLFLRDSALAWDHVDERRPWCEWRFVFRDGRLERCETVRLESREAVADALRREGLEVLADDERLARLHYERGRNRGRSDW
jgi:hypothetical protein